jgi:phosphatidylethanolamine/phosphatidyl-N-methylethanolamine N-methyltransferase
MVRNAPAVRKEATLRSNFVFLGKFLRHGTKIASVWPSSKFLSRATIREVDFDKAKVIVELGAGTGPITDAVISKLKPHTRFLAIERDKDLLKILQDRFSGLHNVEIIHADVRDLDALLKARKIDKVDYFVSGLPTPSLPEGVQRRMLACVRKYMPAHGVYSNITEVPYYYWKYYKAYFKDVDFQFVPVNMPPGGVYHCRAMRQAL